MIWVVLVFVLVLAQINLNQYPVPSIPPAAEFDARVIRGDKEQTDFGTTATYCCEKRDILCDGYTGQRAVLSSHQLACV
jgi:hypothetical protein